MKNLYGLFVASGDFDSYVSGTKELFDWVYADDLESAMLHFINLYRFRGKRIGSIYCNCFELPVTNTICFVQYLEVE